MCLEDIRLGRQSGSVVTSVTFVAAAAAAELVKHNPKRTHLAIYSSNRRNLSIAPQGVIPSATAGIAMCFNSTVGVDISREQTQPIELDIQIHGLVVTFPWQGIATDGADAIVMVIETFLEKD